MNVMYSKQEVFCRLLETEESVLVRLDSRIPGVVVPEHCRADPSLVLRLGVNLVPEIPMIHWSDVSLQCQLRFSGESFLCVVPWRSVYYVVSERDSTKAFFWPESAPSEALEDPEPELPKPKRHLRLV